MQCKIFLKNVVPSMYLESAMQNIFRECCGMYLEILMQNIFRECCANYVFRKFDAKYIWLMLCQVCI
jgi:hypothetical protein